VSLDEAEHERIFRERIVRREFADATASSSPGVVLLGGQPGSGKSALLDVATEYLSTPSARAVQIVGDDLRDYHPDYQRLLTDNDRTAAAATDRDSGRWVQKCLAYAREHRYSVVIEGTMRDPRVPLATAADFRAAGYRVEAWVMAVDPLSSRLGILARYHEQRAALGYGRFTVDVAHDAAVAGVLDSVDALQDAGAVERMLVVARGPEAIADLAGDALKPRTRAVIDAERARPWTPKEVQAFVAQAEQFGASLPPGHDHHALLAELKAAAVTRGAAHPVAIARRNFPARVDLREALRRPASPEASTRHERESREPSSER
jgi:hypothetical protein